MTPKVLITGANGFLGQHLCVHLAQQQFAVLATNRNVSRIPSHFNIPFATADLTDRTAVHDLIINGSPDVIVHTAAMSKPDECHVNREEAFRQNVTATEHLLTAATQLQKENRKIHFIYISTDFIFGENGPHAEDDVPSPLNYYGETKLEAEKKVLQSPLLTTIVRPVFMYGKLWEGLRSDFIHWVSSSLQKGTPLRVVNDQYRTPTYVEDVCRGIQQIIHQQADGVFHLAGKDIVTPYHMAVTTAEILGLDSSLIEPVNSETFPEPVQRAKRSGLSIQKAVSALHWAPLSFYDGVKKAFM